MFKKSMSQLIRNVNIYGNFNIKYIKFYGYKMYL